MTENQPGEAHLGDGLYASFDGHQIWLRAPQADGSDHRVAIDPRVLRNLADWFNRIGVVTYQGVRLRLTLLPNHAKTYPGEPT